MDREEVIRQLEFAVIEQEKSAANVRTIYPNYEIVRDCHLKMAEIFREAIRYIGDST